MAVNKKGIFFTLAAIALSIVIILSFKVYKTYEMKEKANVIGIRVNTINNFIKDIEQDLEKGLYIASFRAFASMGEYIASNGSFIGDIGDSFNELVLGFEKRNLLVQIRSDLGKYFPVPGRIGHVVLSRVDNGA